MFFDVGMLTYGKQMSIRSIPVQIVKTVVDQRTDDNWYDNSETAVVERVVKRVLSDDCSVNWSFRNTKTDTRTSGGDGGIRIIEKSSHSVDNTQNRHFQAYILYKISSVSPLFLLLTTSIVVKTVVNIPNDSVHKFFVDYIAR